MNRMLQYVSALTLLVPAMVFSQIPNADFENWTGGEPDGWATSNTPLGNTITQSSTAQSGTSSVQGVNVATPVPNINLAGLIQSGAGGKGFPISQHYSSVKGWYQFSGTGGDLFAVNIVFGPIGPGDIGTAVGAVKIGATSGWTSFEVPLTYYLPGTPDTAYLQFSINGPVTGSDVHVGSWFLLDNISFGPVTDVPASKVTAPQRFVLEQNYPNPFNPTTTIRYQLPAASVVRLSVWNLLGQEVSVLVDGRQEAGFHRIEFNASNLPGGMYFARMQAGSFSATVRLVLLK